MGVISSLFNIILTKDGLDKINVDYCAPIDASDHAVILFLLCTEGIVKCEDGCQVKLNYFKGDNNQANELFRNIN